MCDAKRKIEEFNKALNIIRELFPNETIEIVGSFVFYLTGLIDLEDVGDLDIVVNVSPEKYQHMVSSYSIMKMSENINENTEEYKKCLLENETFRMNIKIYELPVCLFIKNETKSETINNLILDYNGFKVQPLKHIFKIKKSYNRKKDRRFLNELFMKLNNLN